MNEDRYLCENCANVYDVPPGVACRCPECYSKERLPFPTDSELLEMVIELHDIDKDDLTLEWIAKHTMTREQ